MSVEKKSYNYGRKEEKKRILNLIKEKMKLYNSDVITADLIENCKDVACKKLLEELEKEIKKK